MNRLYRSAIGSMAYATLATRSDIAYAVGYMSRFGLDPKERHWSAIKRLLRYLKTLWT